MRRLARTRRGGGDEERRQRKRYIEIYREREIYR